MNTRRTQEGQPSTGEWKLLPLLLIPLACCGLPLLLASVAVSAVLGGTVAAAVVLAVAIGLIAWRRRRCASNRACVPDQSVRSARGRR